ncbi:hypothetical protein [Micromonospora sp. URMC 103]|uniref:hypothetical protein n=1 Tax=Micromonospora sp. URMC 103 TaxID=3423406 RepID=UPI003F1C692E
MGEVRKYKVNQNGYDTVLKLTAEDAKAYPDAQPVDEPAAKPEPDETGDKAPSKTRTAADKTRRAAGDKTSN